jgi:hypothetical protein
MYAACSNGQDLFEVDGHLHSPMMRSGGAVHDLDMQDLVLEIDVHQDPVRLDGTAAEQMTM